MPLNTASTEPRRDCSVSAGVAVSMAAVNGKDVNTYIEIGFGNDGAVGLQAVRLVGLEVGDGEHHALPQANQIVHAVSQKYPRETYRYVAKGTERKCLRSKVKNCVSVRQTSPKHLYLLAAQCQLRKLELVKIAMLETHSSYESMAASSLS